MKYGYFEKSEIVYLDINSKVSLWVPCKPIRVLAIFKNTTLPKAKYTLFDYITGICIKHCNTKREAKELCNEGIAIKTQAAIDQLSKTYDIKEVNAI